MSATAGLLQSLDSIAHETTLMLQTIDSAVGVDMEDRRETERRVLEIRARTQEFIDWLAEVRLEEPRN